eukprot:CAMPEP_0172500272 /NCGR_PEP_ID=MMETSP1066-20121228/136318_1 /TAXON_ID=671091 /ORGANISM="Coscinodiscus wailesii, Strain CCMP2513" /LENGTH=77 /DNA_ID=CAMNT_0013274411 /DNA_START=183 /DNA_END=413 /DNA_ORIENTATION=-
MTIHSKSGTENTVSNIEALRNQMPLFGQSSSLLLDASSLKLPRELSSGDDDDGGGRHVRFRLSFGHGARHTNWVEVV